MGFSQAELQEIAIFKNGKKRPISKGNIPVYGGNGILDYADDYNAEGSSIIVGRVGAYCGSIYKAIDKCWISDNAILCKNKDNTDFLYLYYLLKKLDLNKMHIGSSQPLLTQNILNSIKVVAPGYEEQRKIGYILSKLDEKIETNNQINQNLQSMSQLLFKHWFVDFEFPNEEGLPYKSSGGEMVDSELGMIPKGWEVKNITELVDSVSIKHKFDKDKIIFLNTSDILNGEVLNRNYTGVDTLPGQAKKSIKQGDILYSEIRPQNRRFAYIDFSADDYVVSTKLMVLRANEEISSAMIYVLLTSDKTINELQTIAEGRSGTFPQITFNNLKDIKLAVPRDSGFDYDTVYKTLLSKISHLKNENRKLASLRDTLLPKLMSGEIDLTNLQID